MKSTKKAGRPLVESLSPRERSIADCVWLGLPDKIIADELKIRLSTVRWHLGRMFRKLGVHSRVAVAVQWERSERVRIAHRLAYRNQHK